MLSIAWGPPIPRQASSSGDKNGEESSDVDDEEEDWMDSWLVTGCSDSSLRKWDVASGRVIDRMGVEKARGERTLVWTVCAFGFVVFSFDLRHLEISHNFIAMGPLFPATR